MPFIKVKVGPAPIEMGEENFNYEHQQQRRMSDRPKSSYKKNLMALQSKYSRTFSKVMGVAKNSTLPSFRDKLGHDAIRHMKGWAAFKARRKLAWARTKRDWREFTGRLEIWRGSFKTIEGHFGSGVVSYFTFLKWLFFLNLVIFLLIFGLVVVPQVVFNAEGSAGSKNITNQVTTCSELYLVEVDNKDVGQLVLDFLQGTGWMEKTALFYGFFTDQSYMITGTSLDYNMPLAYLLVTFVYFGISLILMVRYTGKGLKNQLIDGVDESSFTYCNFVFANWDYQMNDPDSIELKKLSIYNEIRGELEESRHEEMRQSRTCCQSFCLFLVRLVINIFVIGVLAGSGYLIYFSMIESMKFKERSDYATMNKFVQLLMEFVPSLTITFLNAVIPTLFQLVVKGEKYKPNVEIKLTLTRTVFLRLASLAVLLATVYAQVTCTPKDLQCNVGEGDCTSLRCWETYVGQQIYKLCILDFITVIALIFFVEFPRRLIVTKCNCKVFQLIGRQEFVIPKNVLDVVYSQTLCWLGAFFSPLIPAITVVKIFFVFYLKKLTCLLNYTPSARPYKASRTNTFFMIVLMLAFLLCCFPIAYIIWVIRPSYGCGPFRIHARIINVLTDTIATWPTVLQSILNFVLSAAVAFPAFVILMLVIYYYSAMNGANKEVITLLRQQMLMETRDKQYLIKKVTDLTGESQSRNRRSFWGESSETKNKRPPTDPPASAAQVEMKSY